MISSSCGSLYGMFLRFSSLWKTVQQMTVFRLVFCFSLLFLLQEGNTPQGSSQGVKISEPQKKTSFFRCSLL